MYRDAGIVPVQGKKHGKRKETREGNGSEMEFSLEHLQPKERASFALRNLLRDGRLPQVPHGAVRGVQPVSGEPQLSVVGAGHHLYRPRRPSAGAQAGCDPVHRQDGAARAGQAATYYYHENVYRPSAESHTFKEISQMGLELLGAVGRAEVQQAVCLAAQSLAALGAEWVLEVSHMGYLFGLFDALGVPEAARAQLLEKLRQRKMPMSCAPPRFLRGFPKRRRMPCAVLELSGGYAATLSKAAALCRNPP